MTEQVYYDAKDARLHIADKAKTSITSFKWFNKV